jgi:NADH-quinone oxidoreductase subunit G
MAKIIINGRAVECAEGTPVLKVAVDAGVDVPFYCFHPGLKVVASCRLCLMEMRSKDPKSGEMVWSPRLVPSCQTPAKDGMEVRFDSPNVRQNQRAVMEDYLLNHPLDCPVCDQAGECWLQDYSRKYGNALSRMTEPKTVNPKKSVGSKTLLYQDRCVLCSRCVRFCREVAGTSELCVIRRSSYAEIDAFPGIPLENKLQGNVVDICPVGAMLDKDFLFKQRAWYLKTARSICPHCSAGCTIKVDHNNGQVWRLRPRTNPKVNTWWMCDEGRFGWKYVHSNQRLLAPVGKGAGITWDGAIEAAGQWLAAAGKSQQGKGAAVVLSPMMACEEAWLLAKLVRAAAPQATLVLGPVPKGPADEIFPVGLTDEAKAKFIIRAEKCPNRRGVEAVLKAVGGPQASLGDFVQKARQGQFGFAWIVGGYPREWVNDDMAGAAGKIAQLIVQDIFPSVLSARADLVLPSCAWVEREGTFVNQAGLAQGFERALPPPVGCQGDGQYLYRLAGMEGLFRADRVREQMAGEVPAVAEVYSPPADAKGVH